MWVPMNSSEKGVPRVIELKQVPMKGWMKRVPVTRILIVNRHYFTTGSIWTFRVVSLSTATSRRTGEVKVPIEISKLGKV